MTAVYKNELQYYVDIAILCTSVFNFTIELK